MKKRLLAGVLAGVLAVGALTACGSSNPQSSTAAQTEAGTEAAGTEAAGETTAANGELTPIKVAASATPHAEILEQAKPLLAEQGYDLQVTVFNDYVQPNEVVESGDFDANYFQHIPYLESFNEEKGTHLVNAGGIHYEPFGIYPGTKSSLDDLAEGDTIAVPNDTTNEARALLLLQDQGLIKLKDGAGLTATKKDIVENKKDLAIKEIEAAQIPRSLKDVDIAVVNGNYALEAGLKVNKDALATEDADSIGAKTYGNVVAVKKGNEKTDATKALIKALKSDTVKKYINDKYDGAVVPLF